MDGGGKFLTSLRWLRILGSIGTSEALAVSGIGYFCENDFASPKGVICNIF